MSPSTSSSSSSSSPLDIGNQLLPQQQSRLIKHDAHRRQRKTIAKADLPPQSPAPLKTETETESNTQDTAEEEQGQEPPVANPEPQPHPSESQSNDELQEQDEKTAKTNESEQSEGNYLPQLNETIARLMALQMQPVLTESTLDIGRRRAELKRIMGVRKGRRKGSRKGSGKGTGRGRDGSGGRKGKVALDGESTGKGNGGRQEEESQKEKESMKESTIAQDEIGEDGRKQANDNEAVTVVDVGDMNEESQMGEDWTEKQDQIGSEKCNKFAKTDDGGQIMTQRVVGKRCPETKSTLGAQSSLSKESTKTKNTHDADHNTKDSKHETPEQSNIFTTTRIGLNNRNDKIDGPTTQIETEITHRRLIQDFIEFGQEIGSLPAGKGKRTINDVNTRLPPQFIKAITNKAYGDEFDEAYNRAVEVYVHAPDILASTIAKMFEELSRLMGFGIGDARELSCEKEGGVGGDCEDGLVGVEVEVKQVEGGEEEVGSTHQDAINSVPNSDTELEKDLHHICEQPNVRSQSSAAFGQNAVNGPIASSKGKGMKRKGKAKGEDLEVDQGRSKNKDCSISQDMVAHTDLSTLEVLTILNESIDRLLEKAKKQEKNIGNMIRELRKSMTELDSLQEQSQ